MLNLGHVQIYDVNLKTCTLCSYSMEAQSNAEEMLVVQLCLADAVEIDYAQTQTDQLASAQTDQAVVSPNNKHSKTGMHNKGYIFWMWVGDLEIIIPSEMEVAPHR